jgi:hypothetical protein
MFLILLLMVRPPCSSKLGAEKINRPQLFGRWLNSNGMRGAEASGRFQRESANAAGLARVTRAAASAASNVLGIAAQLPGRNRSRAENGRQHRRQQQVLDEIPSHDSHPFR